MLAVSDFCIDKTHIYAVFNAMMIESGGKLHVSIFFQIIKPTHNWVILWDSKIHIRKLKVTDYVAFLINNIIINYILRFWCEFRRKSRISDYHEKEISKNDPTTEMNILNHDFWCANVA